MKVTKGHLWAGLVALIVAGALAYAFWPKPVPVDLASVVRGSLQVTVEDDGKTRIKERYVVSAPVAGRLQRVEWKEGDPVEAGKTLLAVIDPSDPALLDPRAHAQAEAQVNAAEAARKQARANLDRARATEQLAKADLARAKKLLAQGAMSQQSFDSAEERQVSATENTKAADYAVRIAEFELAQAQAVLRRVQPQSSAAADPPRFEIVAPVSGLVLRRFQESATPVTPGMPLVEVGDPADLEIVVDVLSSDAVKIRPGMKMWLEHWGGGQPLLARVRRIEPAAFLKVSALGVEEQRVNVIGDFAEPVESRATLGDAYRVEVRIVIWEGEDLLTVPASALFRHDEHWAVFQVVAGRARLRRVEIGHQNGLQAEVRSGLSAQDQVVLFPGDRIKDGIKVVGR